MSNQQCPSAHPLARLPPARALPRQRSCLSVQVAGSLRIRGYRGACEVLGVERRRETQPGEGWDWRGSARRSADVED